MEQAARVHVGKHCGILRARSCGGSVAAVRAVELLSGEGCWVFLQGKALETMVATSSEGVAFPVWLSFRNGEMDSLRQIKVERVYYL